MNRVKNGSTLVVLVILIALMTSFGASLLCITTLNYKIKKSNSEIKQSFYMSETGLNMAYVDAYELIVEAIEYSVSKTDYYLAIYPLNEYEAMNIFKDNYKEFILDNIAYRIVNNSNPIVEIINEESLFFIENKLTLNIVSKYVSENNIEKIISTDLCIYLPNYTEVILDGFEFSSLVVFDMWKLII